MHWMHQQSKGCGCTLRKAVQADVPLQCTVRQLTLYEHRLIHHANISNSNNTTPQNLEQINDENMGNTGTSKRCNSENHHQTSAAPSDLEHNWQPKASCHLLVDSNLTVKDSMAITYVNFYIYMYIGLVFANNTHGLENVLLKQYF